MNPNPPTSWFDALWPRLVSATGVGYVATAYAVSRWLMRRSPAVVAPPTNLGAVELLECTTCDGVRLKGWCFEPIAPRATVALFHGMRSNRASLMDRIGFLVAAGYRCVAFDHRAHGESAGRFCSFGYHERHDVAAIADLVRTRWPSDPSAAVAISMGAAAVCYAGSAAAQAFDVLVLESVYHDLDRAFQNRVGCGFPTWFNQFRQGILWFTERRLGTSVHEVAPAIHIAKLAPRPVLLVTGSDDPHAPPDEVQALADRIADSSHLAVIPGAGHNNVCDHGGPVYRDLLLGFLERHLFQQRLASAA